MALQEKGGHKKQSPESEARTVALILTAMVWLVVAALCILLPPQSLEKPVAPVYQSISLKLAALEGGAASREPLSEAPVSQAVSPASTETLSEAQAKAPATTPTEASPLPEKVPAPAVATKPVEKVSRSTPVEHAPSQKSVRGTETSAGSSATSPVPSSAPANDSTRVPNVESFDEAAWEALFAEKGSRTYNTSPSAPTSQAVSPVSSSSLSGVAGTSSIVESTDSSSKVSAGGAWVSSQRAGQVQAESQSLSQGTASALERIASVAEGGLGSASTGESKAVGTASGTVAPTSDTSENGTSMNLVGGGSRRLLEPQEPVIVISPQNQSYIKGSTEVTITFEITPEGLVLPGSIKITPESLVHGQVQAEIKSQIEKWRFQVAKGSGQVRFKYNIIKK